MVYAQVCADPYLYAFLCVYILQGLKHMLCYMKAVYIILRMNDLEELQGSFPCTATMRKLFIYKIVTLCSTMLHNYR